MVPDFAAIRLGVGAWSLVALIAFERMARAAGLGEGERRRALWVFVRLPSLTASLALLPQEEVYVALFAMALFAAAQARRFSLLAAAATVSVLAGKVLLAALIVPLACSTPRPLRELARACKLLSVTLSSTGPLEKGPRGAGRRTPRGGFPYRGVQAALLGLLLALGVACVAIVLSAGWSGRDPTRRITPRGGRPRRIA